MVVAISGATGRLGRATISALKAAGARSEDILALARRPEDATDLDVSVRAFDYDVPSSLEASLSGVEKLLLISSNDLGRRVVQHRAVIRAAERAGVKLIGYTSIVDAVNSPFGLAAEHRETEADIRAVGLPWVMLRNSWYSENFMGQVPRALTLGIYAGATKNARITSASINDYAAAAAAVLVSEGHAGRTYELTGDTPFTLTDLCLEISRQSGREIRYEDLSPEGYVLALKEAGVSQGEADFLAGLDLGIAQGALDHVSDDFGCLVGRPVTPLSCVVAKGLSEHSTQGGDPNGF
ncbi:SDR family oxidoreductase [Frateuria aurantia]